MIWTGFSISRGSSVAGRIVLGLDNAFDFLNIALTRDGSLLEERHIRPHDPPSQTISSEVSGILSYHECNVQDLSLIVVSLGPGSFTGIRVGLAFCKGLAAGKNIPLIGVPTLDALASPFSFLNDYHLCPLIDAKKGEVFFALYRVTEGRIDRISGYQAIRPANLPAVIKTPCVCFGTGVSLCRDILSSLPGVVFVKEGFSRISGEVLIREGLRIAERGVGYDLKPIYGRRSEAEIKFDVKVT